MTLRPLSPPAQARAMYVLSSSSSGVGTYGGLNICAKHTNRNNSFSGLQTLDIGRVNMLTRTDAQVMPDKVLQVSKGFAVTSMSKLGNSNQGRLTTVAQEAGQGVVRWPIWALTSRSTLCCKLGRNGTIRSP